MRGGIKIGKIETELITALDNTENPKKALFAVLLDPDTQNKDEFLATAQMAVEGGADLLLVGGSFMGNPYFSQVVQALKEAVSVPVVLFPGGAGQVQPGPDAILFTSLVSGRNPQYLIEQQIQGGVIVRAMGMEAIPTAYCLIDGGKTTAVEYISNTTPVPADKPKITMATAMGAELMGMRWIYLEAGSGAENAVGADHIALVRQMTQMHIIAGGGIRTPELAARQVAAGADIIVTGTIWEQQQDGALLKEFAQAIHG
jgi:putative glycerol-1-phosphate prenyltransferase/phosphoglycerol geranylgeranyltransferase